MPRNLRGGKAYKKKKKPVAGGEETRVERFIGVDRDQGVDYARVLRALGNRRMLCFCNDGVERVCKIRGALCKGPKRKKIEIGDIVAVSYRGMAFFEDDSDYTDSDDDGVPDTVGTVTTAHRGGTSASAASEMTPTASAATLDSGRKDIADIVHKYDSRNWRDIRKAGGIHPQLFSVATTAVEGAVGGAGMEDDIFEEERPKEGSGSGSDSDGDSDSDLDVDAI